MGTEYCLYNPNTRTRFYLGRGPWQRVFKDKTFKFNSMCITELKLYSLLLTEIASTYDEETKLSVFRKCAYDIIDWAKDDMIKFYEEQEFVDAYWNDVSLEIFHQRFPIMRSINEISYNKGFNGNQSHWETIRDLVSMIGNMRNGETMTITVKRTSNTLFNWTTSNGWTYGPSEWARALREAYSKIAGDKYNG